MGEEPNFLSEIAVALSEIGIGVELKTMKKPGETGPALRFWARPESATELAETILESVEEWRETQRH